MFYQILINELVLYNKKQQDQENKIVKNLGGLYIVGTERNDSRRVDNQEVDVVDRVIPVLQDFS
jgi:preprotein translocase subunit SecA